MIDELNGDFLQWLRGFYYIARTGSVRKAAELMHRNPSTISYQLRCLEEELNVVLFDRYKKSLRITQEGKKLLDWAVSTFETLQSMRSSVANANGELQGNLKIAVTFPMLMLVSDAIVNFIQAFPKVNLTVERGMSMDVRNSVVDSLVDFGLMPVITKPKQDKFEVTFKARPILVLHRDSPWEVADKPDVEDLKRLPYVAYCDSDDQDDLNMYVLANLGDFITKNAVLSVNNYHFLMRFVSHKLGAYIVDELCFHASIFCEEWDKLKVYPLDHILPYRLYGILTRRNKYLSPQAEELLKELQNYFQTLPPAPDTLKRIRQS